MVARPRRYSLIKQSSCKVDAGKSVEFYSGHGMMFCF